ncbi:hypothetical protein ACR42D_10010 [Desulfovibrio caledoniensis]
MCGGGGIGGNKSGGKNSASSDFGGYSFGHGKGSVASQGRDANRGAISAGSNISNYAGGSGGKGGKGTMGAPEANVQNKPVTAPENKAPTVAPGMWAGKISPVASFAAMQEDIDKDKAVNAAQYTHAFNTGLKYGKVMETGRNMLEAQRVDPHLGTFQQPKGSKSLSWNTLEFHTNRGIKGSLLDAVTGKNRTYSMKEAEKDVEKGKWSNRAKSLSTGNTEVDENGYAVKDKLGTALDIAAPVASLLSMALTGPTALGGVGFLNDLDNLKTNTEITDSLYGKDKPSVNSRGQAAVAGRVDGNPVSGMLGSDTKQRSALFGVGKAQPGKKARPAPSARTAKPVARRTRQSLLLTGPMGLTDGPDRIFRKLYGA